MPERSPSAAWVLAATILGSSLVFIDGTVVSIALPVLQRELGTGALEVQWVVEAYTLVLGALMLLCGALGDRYGRKKIFIIGVAIFAVGSLLCGLSPNIGALIAARVLQGIGGTLLAPASLAILGACFSGAARGKAVGTWSGLTAVASTAGPVLGGAIIDHFGWRWVFFINLPLALAVIAITLRHVPESRDESEKGSLDIAGSALVTAGLGLIVYAFVAGGSAWNAMAYAALFGGILALGAFIFVERHVARPILPLNLFSSMSFSGLNAMTFLLYGALGGLFYFLPFVMIGVDGFSATMAGLASLPFVALMVLLSRFSGGLLYRVGGRLLLTVGPAITALGFAGFAFLDMRQYWTGIFPCILLVGAGMGLTVSPLTASVLGAVPPQHVGLASGINTAVSRVAGLLAIAVFGALLAFAFSSRLAVHVTATGLSSAERADVDTHSADMLAAQLPAREMGSIKASYLDAFRAVALACALLALASAATAGATLGETKPASGIVET